MNFRKWFVFLVVIIESFFLIGIEQHLNDLSRWLMLVIVVLICVASQLNEKESEFDTKEYFSHFDNFSPTQQFNIGNKIYCGLAFDEERKKIFLNEGFDKDIAPRIISYQDLLSVELLEDGVSVTKTARTSQIGGALIGGLALGGIGVLIGSLSGRTETSDKVEKIILRLVINDTTKPIHNVYFLQYYNGIEKNTSLYQKAIQKAQHWNRLLEVLIKRADIEDKENTVNNVGQTSQNPIADEIKKLAELRDSGILSDKEFQHQKEKLLA